MAAKSGWRRQFGLLINCLGAVCGLSGLVNAAGPNPSIEHYIGSRVSATNGVDLMRFSGIRYAQPPVKDLRWRAPQSVAAPTGGIDATTWPPACTQDDGNIEWYRSVAAAFGQPAEIIPAKPKTSEDCLFLNLWTPDISGKLPVMVWIHGGGNQNGWSFESNYLGRELAADGLVVVSIQYRLGVFGFLAHPSLSAESAHGSSGNYGILDQLQALHWIRRHIHLFGGDANNITLFGESAGAGNINYLLLSPLAEGLFHRAISQSGGWPFNQRRTLADNEAEGLAFLAAAGVGGVAQLRSMASDEVLSLAATHFKRQFDDPPVDGWLLPAPPAQLLAQGKVSRRPAIFGFNANEWLLDLADPTEAQWRQALAQVPNPSEVRALLAAKPLRERLDALLSAVWFQCPSLALADGFAASGAPTYVYRFDRVRQGDHSLGAYHGAEIPYVFNTHDAWLPATEADHRLTKHMMEYWLHFATNGDPNHTAAPLWPSWRQAAQKALVLDGKIRVEALDRELCALLQ